MGQIKGNNKIYRGYHKATAELIRAVPPLQYGTIYYAGLKAE